MDAEGPLETSARGPYVAAILDPAGAVIVQHHRTYQNIDEWISEVRSAWIEWRVGNPVGPPPRGGLPKLVRSA
jgi:hypothetical protein